MTSIGTLLLQAIPEEGTTLILDDLPQWRAALEEFHMDCRFERPLHAEVFVLPQADGVLLRGRFTAEVVQPCNRCAEDARLSLDENFDAFEPYPAESQDGDERPDDLVLYELPRNKGLEINPAALVWQEFVLALPVKPLCSEGCKGLCPRCGADRNTETCNCAREGHDPRLAALRNYKTSK